MRRDEERRRTRGSRHVSARRAWLLLGLAGLLGAGGCAASGPVTTSSPAAASTAAPTATTSATPPGSGSLAIVGRIVTMSDPPIAEALLIEDGTVTAVGTRDDVLARAGDEVPVVDIGENVAYPGFIDAHAHWIGDRELLRCGFGSRGHGPGPHPWLDLDLRAVGQPGAAGRAHRSCR